MKKMWKLNNKAVSPVIATILMVAITVVLAAVLYVMVMGFGGESNSNPTASITASTESVAHTEKVTVASISDVYSLSTFKVSIVIGGTSYVATLAGGNITSAFTAALPAGTYISFVDLGNDAKLGAGDYFLVKTTASGAAMEMNLLYGTNNDSIASDSWTQP